MVLEHKNLIDANLSAEQKDELDAIISRYQSRSEQFDSTGGSPKKESSNAGKK